MNRVRWKLVLLAMAIMVFASWGIWYRWFRPSIEQLMRRGIFAANRQDTATAIQMLDRVLSRDPSHQQALMMRGQLAREAGDSELALSLWRKIPDDVATNAAMARFLEGSLLLDNGKARIAEQSLRKAIELNPAHLRSREMLLQLYVLQLREADVRNQLLGLREYQPWSLEQLLLYSLSAKPVDISDENQARLEKFTRNDPLDAASILGLLRRRSVQEANEADVLLQARAALKRMPENTELLGFVVGLLLQSADLAAAEAVLGSPPPEGLVSLELLRSLGTYFADVRQWTQARTCFERLLQVDSEDLPSNYRLGLVLEALGEKEAGSKFLEKAKLLERLAARVEHIARQVELMNNKGQMTREELAAPAIEVARLYLAMERPAVSRLWLHQSLEWAPQNATAQQFIREFGGNRLLAAVTNAELKGERRSLANSEAGSPTVTVPPGLVFLKKSAAAPIASNEPTQIVFRDCHADAGVNFQYFNGESESKYLLESMGGGVAVLDYDGDGWPDLYFTQGTRVPVDLTDKTYQDRLFRNLGNGRFEDVTLSSGLGDNRYSQGCAAGDIDNDGHTDLLVANWGETVLYMNNGDGTFVEKTAAAGLGGKQIWNSSLALADFNRDGNLDLYVVTYVQDALRICRSNDGRPGACDPKNFAAEPDFLYLSRGDGTFAEVSASAGIDVPDGKGLGILVADFDRDGWPDIYVANDGTPNFVFRNLGASGELRFSEEGLTSGGAVSHDGLAQGSMGIAAGDFDEDGRLDLYVTNFYSEGSALYLYQGDMSFIDSIRAANLYACTRLLVGFGTQAADFNLDGKLDIYATNGHVDDFRFRGIPWKMPSQVFANRGGGSFVDQSRNAGPIFLEDQLGRGAARLDYDGDGRPDIAVSYLDRPAALLRNESEPHGNSLAVDLIGVVSNRNAIGAIISVQIGQQAFVREICGGDGYYASNELRQIFGTGTSTVVDKIEITWPSGAKTELEQVATGRKLTVIEKKNSP